MDTTTFIPTGPTLELIALVAAILLAFIKFLSFSLLLFFISNLLISSVTIRWHILLLVDRFCRASDGSRIRLRPCDLVVCAKQGQL